MMPTRAYWAIRVQVDSKLLRNAAKAFETMIHSQYIYAVLNMLPLLHNLARRTDSRVSINLQLLVITSAESLCGLGL